MKYASIQRWGMPLRPLLKSMNLINLAVYSQISKAVVNSSEAYPTYLYSKFPRNQVSQQ